jgi:ppGpp synthetase/RelA/SpoT-type nucleotidyltranferase
MAWIEPAYSIQEINAAGRKLVSAMNEDWFEWNEDQWAEYRRGVYVINNWRSAHAYPLNTFQVNLRSVSRRIDSSSLVAQRIKRLSSIGHKLDRFRSMKLSQMQDLGGCRAIFQTAADVRKAVDYYLFKSAIKHERVAFDDYLTKPKQSGYRGAHLIYRYFSDKSKSVYNGLKIEMQLRSRYQHAWATAVETVGTFSGQALKSSLGSEEWQRFFALMASAIALREKSNLVPDTPSTRRELSSELKEYSRNLNVEHRLREYSRALHKISSASTAVQNAHIYLLELDPIAGTLDISGFRAFEREIAEQKYADAEIRQKSHPGRDAVLVSVESVNSLHKAYPNYFADTRVFLELMSQAISGKSRGIVVDKLAELPLT